MGNFLFSVALDQRKNIFESGQLHVGRWRRGWEEVGGGYRDGKEVHIYYNHPTVWTMED